jgi:deoxyribonuclease-4
LINLCAADSKFLEGSRLSFFKELQRSEALGIPYVVVHPGSHMGRGETAGMRSIAESLNIVINQCPDYGVKVLLEITAGQGGALGYRFEQLAEIKFQVEAKERIGVCLDTCHIFAAGYEIRTKDGYEKTIRNLDETIGVDQVGVIHANDSMREIGSRVDRHTHIGEGEIGLAGFQNFINDARFQHAPMIIETPEREMDKKNLRQLRKLLRN